jgi:hypothetical protein
LATLPRRQTQGDTPGGGVKVHRKNKGADPRVGKDRAWCGWKSAGRVRKADIWWHVRTGAQLKCTAEFSFPICSGLDLQPHSEPSRWERGTLSPFECMHGLNTDRASSTALDKTIITRRDLVSSFIASSFSNLQCANRASETTPHFQGSMNYSGRAKSSTVS